MLLSFDGKKIDPQLLKNILLCELQRILRKLILDPDFNFSVEAINFMMKKDFLGLSKYVVIYARIRTNNRPLLLGQFRYFPINGLRGFHNNWIEGHLTGFINEKFKVATKYFVHIDVFPYEDLNYTYKYVPLERAIANGILPKKSPFVKMMEKYNVKYVLLAGSIVSGPSLDSMLVVEDTLRKNKIKTVLDLFCGTGSLTKIALSNGAKKATCVDVTTEIARANLNEFRDRVNIIEKNMFNYKPQDGENYDLIIADPFFDDGLNFVELLAPVYAGKGKIFMMTVSFIEDIFWRKTILSRLRKIFSMVKVVSHGRLVHALCKGQRGK